MTQDCADQAEEKHACSIQKLHSILERIKGVGFVQVAVNPDVVLPLHELRRLVRSIITDPSLDPCYFAVYPKGGFVLLHAARLGMPSRRATYRLLHVPAERRSNSTPKPHTFMHRLGGVKLLAL